MITPLCGNSISMGLHAGMIAFECIDDFLQKKIERKQMEDQYSTRWKKEFSQRLRAGRLIQRFFGKEFITNLLIEAVKPFRFSSTA